MKTIEQAFQSKHNNFDLLRIAAALLVLASHSYPLTGNVDREIFGKLLGYDSGGTWGVAVFFVISGFLVTKSATERAALDYLKSRALRIVPGLVLASLFDVFVVGLLFTTLPAREFLAHPQTWNHLRNGLVFGMEPSLPGVFAGQPERMVNGSLWTLPIECSFYILLPLLGVFGLLRRRYFLLLPAAAAVTLTVGLNALGWSWGNQGGYLFVSVPSFAAVKNALFFLIGGALWIYRDRVPLEPGLALCCVLLLAISGFTHAKWVVFYLAIPYLTIYLALAHPVPAKLYHTIGDLSYGTYLFAFPIQQAVVALAGADILPTRLTLAAAPLTLLMAAFSWHCVERRAMAFRRGIRAQG